MSGGDVIKDKNTDRTSRAHRISFSVVDGIRESIRTVSWRFELPTNGDSGKQEWEEHMIRLLWSPGSSGVARVTLLSSRSICPPLPSWEQNTIKTIRKETVVEFTWETLSHQEFRVVAYSVPSPVFRQYELWIGGVSFFELEEKSTLLLQDGIIQAGKPFDESKLQDLNVKESTTESLSMDTLPHNTPISSGAEKGFDQNQPHFDGGSMCNNICRFDKYCDENRPENDATSFDEQCNSARMNMVPNGPQCHVESQAIKMAFSDDKNFSRCHPLTDSCRIEANALCDAYDFMRRNAHPSAAVPDNETERITIVHDQLVQMVNNVRRGAISPTAAARTIHSIQMITGLAEFPAIWEVTVVFFGLKDTTTSSELRKTMEQFGEIEAAAVADSGRGFGFCSFRSSSSAWYSIQGCRNREALLNGEPLNAMRIQNGNWLDPILLSPTTPKRSNLNLSMNTYTEEEEKQPIPDLVSSTTSSPVLKASSAMSPPKNTPIRFLKKFFKSPKQPEPENNDNETGAPQIPMLDHAKENENCCDNKDIFLRMDDDIQEPDDDDINPPMIRRRSWRFDVISDDTSHESPTSGEQIKEKVQRQAVISETSSRRLCNDTEEPEVNDSNDSSFPPTVQNAKINSNIVNNQHLHGKCSDPTINNKNKSLQSEIKSPRGVFFGLSPLKPRAIFHRRQHPCSVSNSSIAVTHISDDDWTNDTNTFVGEKIY